MPIQNHPQPPYSLNDLILAIIFVEFVLSMAAAVLVRYHNGTVNDIICVFCDGTRVIKWEGWTRNVDRNEIATDSLATMNMNTPPSIRIHSTYSSASLAASGIEGKKSEPTRITQQDSAEQETQQLAPPPTQENTETDTVPTTHIRNSAVPPIPGALMSAEAKGVTLKELVVHPTIDVEMEAQYDQSSSALPVHLRTRPETIATSSDSQYNEQADMETTTNESLLMTGTISLILAASSLPGTPNSPLPSQIDDCKAILNLHPITNEGDEGDEAGMQELGKAPRAKDIDNVSAANGALSASLPSLTNNLEVNLGMDPTTGDRAGKAASGDEFDNAVVGCKSRCEEQTAGIHDNSSTTINANLASPSTASLAVPLVPGEATGGGEVTPDTGFGDCVERRCRKERTSPRTCSHNPSKTFQRQLKYCYAEAKDGNELLSLSFIKNWIASRLCTVRIKHSSVEKDTVKGENWSYEAMANGQMGPLMRL
ncbi:hypothetical protein BDP27DRAFT_1404468 [Rhodocollybia butyracea]|uniref:Uncharacterized protein n=1 Tax=Rhodocollybia butyracea TaxID=206335 RepID=A0A9P5PLV1_9AGAR|nr:hypothetical protein BDP27DRAFT_1404468 [Rhodocollybia butyracea]